LSVELAAIIRLEVLKPPTDFCRSGLSSDVRRLILNLDR
jgi:hypothetical protein